MQNGMFRWNIRAREVPQLRTVQDPGLSAWLDVGITQDDQTVSENIMRMWVQLARTGDPN